MALYFRCMTVEELRFQLRDYDGDLPVFLLVGGTLVRLAQVEYLTHLDLEAVVLS
jgi:hypothetical protein